MARRDALQVPQQPASRRRHSIATGTTCRLLVTDLPESSMLQGAAAAVRASSLRRSLALGGGNLWHTTDVEREAVVRKECLGRPKRLSRSPARMGLALSGSVVSVAVASKSGLKSLACAAFGKQSPASSTSGTALSSSQPHESVCHGASTHVITPWELPPPSHRVATVAASSRKQQAAVSPLALDRSDGVSVARGSAAAVALPSLVAELESSAQRGQDLLLSPIQPQQQIRSVAVTDEDGAPSGLEWDRVGCSIAVQKWWEQQQAWARRVKMNIARHAQKHITRALHVQLNSMRRLEGVKERERMGMEREDLRSAAARNWLNVKARELNALQQQAERLTMSLQDVSSMAEERKAAAIALTNSRRAESVERALMSVEDRESALAWSYRRHESRTEAEARLLMAEEELRAVCDGFRATMTSTSAAMLRKPRFPPHRLLRTSELLNLQPPGWHAQYLRWRSRLAAFRPSRAAWNARALPQCTVLTQRRLRKAWAEHIILEAAVAMVVWNTAVHQIEAKAIKRLRSAVATARAMHKFRASLERSRQAIATVSRFLRSLRSRLALRKAARARTRQVVPIGAPGIREAWAGAVLARLARKRATARRCATIANAKAMFQLIDANGDGTLSFSEVATAFRRRGVDPGKVSSLSDLKRVRNLFSAVDDGDGMLTITEWTAAVCGTTDTIFLGWMRHELEAVWAHPRRRAAAAAAVADAAAAAVSGSLLMTAADPINCASASQHGASSTGGVSKGRRFAVTSNARVGAPHRLATAPARRQPVEAAIVDALGTLQQARQKHTGAAAAARAL